MYSYNTEAGRERMKYGLHTSYQWEEPSLTETSYHTRGTRYNLDSMM
jgi:hypothetical protein